MKSIRRLLHFMIRQIRFLMLYPMFSYLQILYLNVGIWKLVQYFTFPLQAFELTQS